MYSNNEFSDSIGSVLIWFIASSCNCKGCSSCCLYDFFVVFAIGAFVFSVDYAADYDLLLKNLKNLPAFVASFAVVIDVCVGGCCCRCCCFFAKNMRVIQGFAILSNWVCSEYQRRSFLLRLVH